MIQLAEIFSSKMILQRDTPVKVWGKAKESCNISVCINDLPICDVRIEEGDFFFFIPAQSAMENAKIEIGNILLEDVDFGEVWIAGGQSNMEFLLKYEENLEEVKKYPEDEHIRYYDVGKYQFKGEREEGVVTGEIWDRWTYFNKETLEYFSSVAFYFAKEIREKYNVPVGIIGCNYGGTSASAWMDDKYLTGSLKAYVDDYKEGIKKIDLDEYYKINKKIRHNSVKAESKKVMEDILYGGKRMEEAIAQIAKREEKQKEDNRQKKVKEMMNIIGPEDKNRPGALYESMVKKIMGFRVKGVLWYQGESDERYPNLYSKLFTAMINCWRNDWKTELPFLFVQLAPFGTWMGGNGDKFPILRQEQELVADTVSNTYMISSSDVGDKLDIHPKNKKPLGIRLSLAARKNVYNEELLWKYPKITSYKVKEEEIHILFENNQGLFVEGDKINDLLLLIEGKELKDYNFTVHENRIIIKSKKIKKDSQVTLSLGDKGYYKINIYNQAGIPAVPYKS